MGTQGGITREGADEIGLLAGCAVLPRVTRGRQTEVSAQEQGHRQEAKHPRSSRWEVWPELQSRREGMASGGEGLVSGGLYFYHRLGEP